MSEESQYDAFEAAVERALGKQIRESDEIAVQ